MVINKTKLNDRRNSGNNNGHWTVCFNTTRSSIVIKPDKYIGDEDWEQYISHFEDYAVLCQWNDWEMFLTSAHLASHTTCIFIE